MIGSLSSTQPPLPTVCGSQEALPVAIAGVDLEDRDRLPCLDTFEIEPRDNPVVGEAESESGIVIKVFHSVAFRAASSRAAISRFRSAVYFHQGFFGDPSMKRTAAMNVSSVQGS